MKKQKKSEPGIAQIEMAKLAYEFDKKVKAIEDKYAVTISAEFKSNCQPYPRKKVKPTHDEDDE